jgi:hypothetical protein
LRCDRWKPTEFLANENQKPVAERRRGLCAREEGERRLPGSDEDRLGTPQDFATARRAEHDIIAMLQAEGLLDSYTKIDNRTRGPKDQEGNFPPAVVVEGADTELGKSLLKSGIAEKEWDQRPLLMRLAIPELISLRLQLLSRDV